MDAKRLIRRTFSALMRLYPQSFRAEFGEEMQAVFAAAIAKAAENGPVSLVTLCWRELSHLPVNLLREHLPSCSKENYVMMSKKWVLILGLALTASLAGVLVVIAPWQKAPKVAVTESTPIRIGTVPVRVEQPGRYKLYPAANMTLFVTLKEADGSTRDVLLRHSPGRLIVTFEEPGESGENGQGQVPGTGTILVVPSE